MTESQPDYVCPACRSTLLGDEQAFACPSCLRSFPILFGIPDFRLQGDRYLTLEEERAKAAKLHRYGEAHDFPALVAHYYSLTDDVPAHLERIFTAYVLQAELRSRSALLTLGGDGGHHLLDLGCGSGGALLAARSTFHRLTGVDIALRWLVIAQKRLQEKGVAARLVCADASALPFTNDSFDHILASDLLENTRSPAATINAAACVLAPGGRLYVSSSNGNWLGPHPATGVWAAGLLPSRVRSGMLRRRHGVDLLRAVSFVRPASVRRMATAAGLRQIDASALEPDLALSNSRTPLFRFFAKVYLMMARLPILRTALLHAGPVFQAIFVKEGRA